MTLFCTTILYYKYDKNVRADRVFIREIENIKIVGGFLQCLLRKQG